MRAMIAIGLLLSLMGCAGQQYALATYGTTPTARVADFDIYDQPAQNRLSIRTRTAVSGLGAPRPVYQAPVEIFLRAKSCVVRDGYQLEIGTWEFTYQCHTIG